MKRPLASLLAILALAVTAAVARAGPIEDRLAEAWGGIDPRAVPTGVLYDRVLPLSGIERFDGGALAPPISFRNWRQLYDELRRASAGPSTRPAPAELADIAGETGATIPIGIVFDRYDRARPDAVTRGALLARDGRFALGAGAAFATHTAFAAAALAPYGAASRDVRLVIPRAAYFSNANAASPALELDAGDGRGLRAVRFDEPVTVRYEAAGTKVLRLRATMGEETLESAFTLPLHASAAPAPDDTLHVTGTIPYLGGVASGDAYVDLAPGHATLVNPVLVIEGFDLDNSMNWDELYEQLNQQNLLESLRADGYDAVVLNFTDATDYIQRNALMLVELLQELQAAVGPQGTIALAGASMGGVVGRYALAYMEANAIPHPVRTFISFDGPHLGANIPLGIQYWFNFFASQSADAQALLDVLNRPAARQMLVYHYSNPPGASGMADPLRATMNSDLAAIGNWPTQPRLVAIANGSDTGLGEPFAPGAQLIRWEYSSSGTVIRGDLWAVPNASPTTKIFDGLIRIFFITIKSQTVSVSATLPYDDAPGGTRATMTQMDTTAAPYGDIVALTPSHCFVPTISALAYATGDLFHDIALDANPVANTPFDAIYAQATNQEHVEITAQNAAWLRSEIEMGVTAVGPGANGAALSLAAGPSPFASAIQVRFVLPRESFASLRVYDVNGREVRSLASGTLAAGPHELTWNGQDAGGAASPAGIYFLRLIAGGVEARNRVVRLTR